MNNNELLKKILTTQPTVDFLVKSDANSDVFIIIRNSNRVTMICNKTELNSITIKINNISLKFIYDLNNSESFTENLKEFINCLKSDLELIPLLSEFMFGGNYNSEFKDKRILKIENSEIYY